MKSINPEILKLGGALATGIVAIACPVVLPALMASTVNSLAPEVAGHLVTSTNYKAFRDFLRKDRPGRLNHDLVQMLLAALERTTGLLETLFEEKEFSASPVLNKVRLQRTKKTFKALKSAIDEDYFKEENASSYLFEDEKTWSGELVKALFETAKLKEQERQAIEAYFLEKFPNLFKLAFEETLKDPANERGWRAFQMLAIEENKQTGNRLENKVDAVQTVINELKKDASPSHLAWLDKIQADVFDFKFKTALEHLDSLEAEMRRVNTLSNIDNAKILLLKGICLYEQNEIEKGEEAWLTAWRYDSKNLQVREKALRVLIDRGKFGPAKKLMSEMLIEDSANPIAWAAKTFLDDGLLEDKLAAVPYVITELETQFQAFKLRLAGFCIQHNKYQDIGRIFKQEIESDIQFPTSITFENKGYWLLLSNFYVSQIAVQHNQIPDYVHPLIKNNPKLPKVIALFEKVLQPFEDTEKGQFLTYYKFWYHYAKYCLVGNKEEALQVLKAYNKLSDKHRTEPIPTLTAFALLQTKQINELLDFTDNCEDEQSIGVLVPRALAFVNQEKFVEAHRTFDTFFDRLEKIDTVHFAAFHSYQYDFTPIQEQRESQWLRLKDKIERPALKKLAAFFTFWDTQSVEERRAKLVELRKEIEATDPELILSLALLFYQNGDFIPTLEILKPIIDFNEESPEHLLYIRSLGNSRHDDAELLSRLEDWRRTGFTVYHDWLFWEIQLLQTVPDAEQILEVVSIGIEKFPDDPRFHMIKAIELERLGQTKELQEFLSTDISFAARLPEPNVIHLSGIMLRNGLIKEGIELIFPLAENPNKELAQANYFFALSMIENLPFPRNLEEVTEDCWVDIEENGVLELHRITPDNSSLPEFKVILGKRVGDVIEFQSLLSSRKSVRTIKEIFDKYVGLHVHIIRKANSRRSLASTIEVFEMPSENVEELNRVLVELFGEDGDRRKDHSEQLMRQYATREIGFFQLTNGLGGNPIEVFYHLANQKDNGIRALPVAAFKYTNEDLLKDTKFAMDFSSLLLFFELSKSGVEFSVKFLVSPFLVEIIEHRRFEIMWVRGSSLSVNITSKGVTPIFYPENYKLVRLEFFDQLLAWVKKNCEVRKSRHKLTVMGHALRDERDWGGMDNPFSKFTLDTLFLSSSPSEKVVLISDDVGYYRFFQGRTNLVSTEVFLSQFCSEFLISSIYPKILQLGYSGFTLPSNFVRAEYAKKAKGDENLFEECLRNLGTNPETVLIILFDIYSSSKLLVSHQRILSQKILRSFLTWGIPNRFVFETFQSLLVMKFRFLPNRTAEVLEDWAIVSGRGYGLISGSAHFP